MAPPSSELPPDVKWINASERPGFPSYAQYKQVETTYLQSLTPRRQGKALISQSLFDRIWDVLHQPEAQGETAQFRFWARKMFTISRTHRVTLGVIDDRDETPHEVLLHDNLLVAIQEQLYDLLCYCHGSTGHGGRDKTCALIRKHYTWVPKDLVSNFIKACPTCIMKKCGSLDTVNIASQINEPKPLEETTLPGIRDFFQNMYPANISVPGSLPGDATPWPLMGVSRESPMSPTLLADDPLEAAYREALFRAREAKASLAGLGNPSGSRLPQTFPMSREVSLYKGLPNGWQFRHADYASAYAEFMRTRDLPVVEEPGPKRPRVPSILPLWGPDQYPHPEFETLESTDAEHLQCPELNSHGSNGRAPGESMQYLLMTSELSKDKPEEYVPQIDPALMQYSHTQEASLPSRAADTEVGGSESTGLLASANHASSSSIKRAAAPLRINLEFPTDKTFQALFAYRESLGEGNLTPDSPLMAWHPGNPSPASSESSSSSHLSAYAMTTPASSALPTPVDECGDVGSSNMVKGKQRQAMPEYTPEEELSGGIQEVCALRSG